MMYSQQPLNAPLGAPAIPQTLTDFIFPDEAGKAEDSVLDDEAVAKIRAIARSSNRKLTPLTAAFAQATQVSPQSSAGSLQQIIPTSQQQLSTLLSSQSLTSQSTTSSAQSSLQSLGSTGSQGLAQMVR